MLCHTAVRLVQMSHLLICQEIASPAARNDIYLLFIPHPWVEVSIEDIGDEVAKNDECRTDDQDSHQ